MAGELRQMDDVAGGGSVLAMARQLFGWVAGLLDRALYSEHTGRALYIMLAELGQPCVAGRRLMRASTGWRSATTSQACAPPTPPMTGPLTPYPRQPGVPGHQPGTTGRGGDIRSACTPRRL